MSELSHLILVGTDAEIRAAAADPTRKRVCSAVAIQRFIAAISLVGMTSDEAVLVYTSVAEGLVRPEPQPLLRALAAKLRKKTT